MSSRVSRARSAAQALVGEVDRLCSLSRAAGHRLDIVPTRDAIDGLDARLLSLLEDDPGIGVLGASRLLGVARGTVQSRLDKLVDRDGKPVPMGVPYAALVESDAPVVVQYSRIDTTQPNETLATTMAYPLCD